MNQIPLRKDGPRSHRKGWPLILGEGHQLEPRFQESDLEHKFAKLSVVNSEKVSKSTKLSVVSKTKAPKKPEAVSCQFREGIEIHEAVS